MTSWTHFVRDHGLHGPSNAGFRARALEHGLSKMAFKHGLSSMGFRAWALMGWCACAYEQGLASSMGLQAWAREDGLASEASLLGERARDEAGNH